MISWEALMQRCLQARIQECDAEIERHLQQLAKRFESSSALSQPEALNEADAPLQNPQPAKRKVKRKPQANEPKIDLADYLRRICGVDLTQVVGLNVLSVLLIVSEIGVDMSKWRSAKAFSAWLGLCPRNKISGRKVLDTRRERRRQRVAAKTVVFATDRRIGDCACWPRVIVAYRPRP